MPYFRSLPFLFNRGVGHEQILYKSNQNIPAHIRISTDCPFHLDLILNKKQFDHVDVWNYGRALSSVGEIYKILVVMKYFLIYS